MTDIELLRKAIAKLDSQLLLLSYGATLTGPIPPAILELASAILGEQDT